MKPSLPYVQKQTVPRLPLSSTGQCVCMGLHLVICGMQRGCLIAGAPRDSQLWWLVIFSSVLCETEKHLNVKQPCGVWCRWNASFFLWEWGAALPSALQGATVQQAVTDVCFIEAVCVLFPHCSDSEQQRNRNKEQGRFLAVPLPRLSAL